MDSSSPRMISDESDEGSSTDNTSGEEEFATPTPTTPTTEAGTSGVGTSSKRKSKGTSHSKKTKRVRSNMWKHFTRLQEDVNRCTCNYCGKDYSCFTTSGTSNLRKHLRSCKQHKVWNSENPKEKQQGITPEGTLTVGRCTEPVWREASNELVVLPFSFTESVGWRHFCNKTNNYHPHSRRTVTRDIVKMFVARKEAMRFVFGANKQRVSLRTDIWVGPTTQCSYMVITAHLIHRCKLGA